MRIALISDIHGNYDALQAVARQMEKQPPDYCYCLGDVIGYGAEPEACVAWVETHCHGCLAGNHERMLFNDGWDSDLHMDVAKAVSWTRSVLSDNSLSIMEKWPFTITLEQLTLVHGSPNEPQAFHYIMGPYDAANAFKAMNRKICFFGHTHLPGTAEELSDKNIRWKKERLNGYLDINHRYLINPGSIGQPRNNNPHAQWITIDTDHLLVRYHACPYPVKDAQQKIIQAGLPSRFAKRLTKGQ